MSMEKEDVLDALLGPLVETEAIGEEVQALFALKFENFQMMDPENHKCSTAYLVKEFVEPIKMVILERDRKRKTLEEFLNEVLQGEATAP